MKRKVLAIFVITAMFSTILFTGCGSETANVKDTAEPKIENVIKVTRAVDKTKLPDEAKNRKDTLIIGTGVPGGNFISYYAQTLTDAYISDVVTDGLVDWDDSGEPIPGIAKKWDISDDGLTYTFHLRDDVKFSDGKPLTADDVKFSLELVFDPSFSGAVDHSAIPIKGGDAFNKGTVKDIEGINVKDPHTISVTLNKPNSSILYLIGTTIISKDYFGKDYVPGNTKGVEAKLQTPVGCGQYKVTKYVPGQEVDLTANKYYWKGTPKIKNLIFKATTEENKMQNLSSGETDIDTFDGTPENIEQLKSMGFLDLTSFPSSSIFYIGVNCKDSKFSDRKVRQALEYGLNRQEMAKTVFKGNAYIINEPQSKAHASYLKDVNEYKYNVSKANKMLDEAGWKKGTDGIREKNGQKFVIHLMSSSTNSAHKLEIPIIKENYKKLGIDVEPELMDLNTLLSKTDKKDFEAYLMGTSLGADALSSNLAANFKTGAPSNNMSYSNSNVDDLIDKAYKESDKDKRTALEQKVYKDINEDLPFIFTYQPETIWVNNSRVTGIKFLPYNSFCHNIYKAEIK
ncbi:Oligopeptide-binding protein, periplasmic component [Clostridium acetobutylicum EA 2018]|uniref:ABC transporter substrate-binding protein n=1 Tax=Clostridium acetobutylicum TaxID=1488 RepID=UPI000200A6FA|nr:ABC transporter substrate-binding protein [Clostridium acetobutylicum]ADZ19221.1 Oligopeptide-binding protein, periplasmic component [Clostridium acetobutylicum EA 2018]